MRRSGWTATTRRRGAFNEAEARTPRMRAWTCRSPRTSCAFNEAEARTPRMRDRRMLADLEVRPFNEAEARTPRMQGNLKGLMWSLPGLQ